MLTGKMKKLRVEYLIGSSSLKLASAMIINMPYLIFRKNSLNLHLLSFWAFFADVVYLHKIKSENHFAM